MENNWIATCCTAKLLSNSLFILISKENNGRATNMAEAELNDNIGLHLLRQFRGLLTKIFSSGENIPFCINHSRTDA